MTKHKFSPRYWIYDLVKIFAGVPGLIWHRPRLYYEDEAAKAPVRGGALAISNHLGFFDPIYMQYALFYRRHHFVCLQKFFEGRLGWLFGAFLCIPIDKENFSVDSFHVIVDHLRAGDLVSIFPEGKVNDGSGRMAHFKSGVILMASQSGKPIIPIYILQKKHWYERVRIMIGHPITVSAASFAAMQEATRLLEEKTRLLKERLEELTCRPPKKKS